MLAAVGLKICRYLLLPELASWTWEKKRPPPDGQGGNGGEGCGDGRGGGVGGDVGAGDGGGDGGGGDGGADGGEAGTVLGGDDGGDGGDGGGGGEGGGGVGGGAGGGGGDGRAYDPRNVQVSWAKTIHSQSVAFVPAEAAQLPALPVVTLILRTSVWSLVAAAVPQTSQPEPGSALKSPTQSSLTWLDSVPKARQ